MSLNQSLSQWIKKIEQENPPPPVITALNFGMLQSDKGYMVYLTGSEIYDPDDDDWAGEIDYQPPRANKYFLIPREFTKGLKWQGVLDLEVAWLKEYYGSGPALFDGRTVTASFDDGKLVLIKEAR